MLSSFITLVWKVKEVHREFNRVHRASNWQVRRGAADRLVQWSTKGKKPFDAEVIWRHRWFRISLRCFAKLQLWFLRFCSCCGYSFNELKPTAQNCPLITSTVIAQTRLQVTELCSVFSFVFFFVISEAISWVGHSMGPVICIQIADWMWPHEATSDFWSEQLDLFFQVWSNAVAGLQMHRQCMWAKESVMICAHV